MPEFIYHIASKPEWELGLKNQSYTVASLQTEGFIHCSRKEQLKTVAPLFFKGQTNLVLLKIDPSKVTSKLIVDQVPHMNDEFPHIYGPLNPSAVISVEPFNPDS